MDKRHLAIEELDRYRAGLLDDVREAQLKAHISDCPACRQKYSDWGDLTDMLRDDAHTSDRTRIRLAQARAQALGNGAPAIRHNYLKPAFAIAAGLVLALGLGIWQDWTPGFGSSPQLARTIEEDVPEVYEDPDFYLWLAGNQESSIRDPGNLLRG